MIPYFKIMALPLGPVSIQVWGLMVALGMVVGLLVARCAAIKKNLNHELFLDLAVWSLVSAMIFGRLGYVLFYNLSVALQDPWMVVRVWDGGMSSFGGYFGATVGAVVFARLKKFKLRPYVELAAFGLPLGYGIGRLGCFFIHDHPGILCDCFFAVAYPGGARLDHGLLLSLFGFVLFAVWLVLRRRGWQPGEDAWRYLPTLLLSYGTMRLVLDFFRAWDLPQVDVRVLYLTPSQFGAIGLIVFAFVLLRPQSKTNLKSSN